MHVEKTTVSGVVAWLKQRLEMSDADVAWVLWKVPSLFWRDLATLEQHTALISSTLGMAHEQLRRWWSGNLQ